MRRTFIHISLLGGSLLLFSGGILAQEPSTCFDRANSQKELNDCAGAELKRADTRLNEVYQQLLKRFDTDQPATQKIRAAQRAWITYRDAQLEADFPGENKRSEYGSVYPMCFAILSPKLTRERIKTLEEMLAAPEGEVCNHLLSKREGKN
jgi:uncharacterized protein YecT (DUF1311 family)